MNKNTVAALITMLKGNLSNAEFAKKAGVQTMQITRWTSGTNITLLDFEKLCVASGHKIHKVLEYLNKTDEEIHNKYNTPIEYGIFIQNNLEELMKLEKMNENEEDPGALIVHMTEQIKCLRETLEKQIIK